MKIAHVSDCYLPRLGGIEAQVHGLARRQRAAGHDAQVDHRHPVARHDRDPRRRGGRRSRPPGDRRPPVRAAPCTRGPAARSCVWSRPAVSTSSTCTSASSRQFAQGAAQALVRAQVPLVVTVHSLWGPAVGLFRLADVLVHWGDWPAVLTAVSEAAARPVRAALRGRAEVGVIPNGIDAGEWRVEPAPRAAGRGARRRRHAAGSPQAAAAAAGGSARGSRRPAAPGHAARGRGR